MRFTLSLVILLLIGGTTAYAATPTEAIGLSATYLTFNRFDTPTIAASEPLPSSPTLDAAFLQPAASATSATVQRAVIAAAPRAARPESSVFTALTSTYVALSSLDSYTTIMAVRNGLKEGNPMLSPIAGHPGALIATKSAMAVTTTLLAKRLWKTHPRAAIVTMLAANVGTTYVIAHNFRMTRAGSVNR